MVQDVLILVSTLLLIPDNMVTRAMGDDVKPKPSRMPPMPADEQVLSSLAVVAIKVG